MSAFRTIEWVDGRVRMLDQRYLPHRTIYNEYTDYREVAEAIHNMVIRGAPALGAAAAFGMALVPFHIHSNDVGVVQKELQVAAETLRQARPTAVNLFWGIDRVLNRLADPGLNSVDAMRQAALEEAQGIAQEDVRINKKLGMNALELIPDHATIIHHCNTGALAAVDYGTALGVIRTAHENGKDVFVLVDETRPRLQGARLTAWELQQYGIPFQVIVDGASGHYMRTLDVDLCIVGCDRVAANGDTANKIGTYNLAVVAHENEVPFYIAAPSSTIDMRTPNGDSIRIEERPAREVTHVDDFQITPDNTAVGNPAFDVTPAKYITAILTELGVAFPPYEKSLANLISNQHE